MCGASACWFMEINSSILGRYFNIKKNTLIEVENIVENLLKQIQQKRSCFKEDNQATNYSKLFKPKCGVWI